MVKRYDEVIVTRSFCGDEWTETTIKDVDYGNYVTYDDYLALQKERDALAAQLSRYSVSAGRADQYKAEANACRKSLGFSIDSECVAPIDLSRAIDYFKQKDSAHDAEVALMIADEIEQGFKAHFHNNEAVCSYSNALAYLHDYADSLEGK